MPSRDLMIKECRFPPPSFLIPLPHNFLPKALVSHELRLINLVAVRKEMEGVFSDGCARSPRGLGGETTRGHTVVFSDLGFVMMSFLPQNQSS